MGVDVSTDLVAFYFSLILLSPCHLLVLAGTEEEA